MRYQITGKQIDIGTALQEHVKTTLEEVIEKYAKHPTDATVIFSKSAGEYVCEAIVHLSTGLTTQAKAHSHDIYAAFETTADKMEKQLRRYKRRLKNHHKQREKPVEVSSGAAYILAADGPNQETEPDTLQPMIIAEMEEKVRSLSVGEAVMQMELIDMPVLVFKNQSHDGINVVYRREDGNIGWIDPK